MTFIYKLKKWKYNWSQDLYNIKMAAKKAAKKAPAKKAAVKKTVAKKAPAKKKK